MCSLEGLLHICHFYRLHKERELRRQHHSELLRILDERDAPAAATTRGEPTAAAAAASRTPEVSVDMSPSQHSTLPLRECEEAAGVPITMPLAFIASHPMARLAAELSIGGCGRSSSSTAARGVSVHLFLSPDDVVQRHEYLQCLHRRQQRWRAERRACQQAKAGRVHRSRGPSAAAQRGTTHPGIAAAAAHPDDGVQSPLRRPSPCSTSAPVSSAVEATRTYDRAVSPARARKAVVRPSCSPRPTSRVLQSMMRRAARRRRRRLHRSSSRRSSVSVRQQGGDEQCGVLEKEREDTGSPVNTRQLDDTEEGTPSPTNPPQQEPSWPSHRLPRRRDTVEGSPDPTGPFTASHEGREHHLFSSASRAPLEQEECFARPIHSSALDRVDTFTGVASPSSRSSTPSRMSRTAVLAFEEPLHRRAEVTTPQASGVDALASPHRHRHRGGHHRSDLSSSPAPRLFGMPLMQCRAEGGIAVREASNHPQRSSDRGERIEDSSCSSSLSSSWSSCDSDAQDADEWHERRLRAPRVNTAEWGKAHSVTRRFVLSRPSLSCVSPASAITALSTAMACGRQQRYFASRNQPTAHADAAAALSTSNSSMLSGLLSRGVDGAEAGFSEALVVPADGNGYLPFPCRVVEVSHPSELEKTMWWLTRVPIIPVQLKLPSALVNQTSSDGTAPHLSTKHAVSNPKKKSNKTGVNATLSLPYTSLGALLQCLELSRDHRYKAAAGVTPITDIRLHQRLHHLQAFSIVGSSIRSSALDILQGGRQLRHVYLDNCPNLRNADVLGSCPKLAVFSATQTPLESIGWMKRCLSLEEVYLTRNFGVRDFRVLAKLKGLRVLHLAALKVVTQKDVQSWMCECTSLQELNIRSCASITDLSPLGSLNEMRVLLAGQLPGLVELGEWITHWRDLAVLDLEGCVRLSNVRLLGRLETLMHVNLSQTCIRTLGWIERGCRDALETLLVNDCTTIVSWKSLRTARYLRHVSAKRSVLTSVAWLSVCEVLQHVELDGAVLTSPLPYDLMPSDDDEFADAAESPPFTPRVTIASNEVISSVRIAGIASVRKPIIRGTSGASAFAAIPVPVPLSPIPATTTTTPPPPPLEATPATTGLPDVCTAPLPSEVEKMGFSSADTTEDGTSESPRPRLPPCLTSSPWDATRAQLRRDESEERRRRHGLNPFHRRVPLPRLLPAVPPSVFPEGPSERSTTADETQNGAPGFSARVSSVSPPQPTPPSALGVPPLAMSTLHPTPRAPNRSDETTKGELPSSVCRNTPHSSTGLPQFTARSGMDGMEDYLGSDVAITPTIKPRLGEDDDPRLLSLGARRRLLSVPGGGHHVTSHPQTSTAALLIPRRPDAPAPMHMPLNTIKMLIPSAPPRGYGTAVSPPPPQPQQHSCHQTEEDRNTTPPQPIHDETPPRRLDGQDSAVVIPLVPLHTPHRTRGSSLAYVPHISPRPHGVTSPQRGPITTTAAATLLEERSIPRSSPREPPYVPMKFASCLSLPLLTILSLNDCFLQSVNWITGCPFLEELSLSGCAALTDLQPIGFLHHLTRLNLDFTRLQDLSWVSHCYRLTEVHLRGCLALKAFEELSLLPRLEVLDLSHTGIESLETFRDHPSLRAVLLRGCKELKDFNPLATLTRLQELDLSRTAVPSLQWLQQRVPATSSTHAFAPSSCPSRLARLREVQLSDCKQLCAAAQLEPLTSLPQLHTLVMKRMILTDIAWLRGCRALKRLMVMGSVLPDNHPVCWGLHLPKQVEYVDVCAAAATRA